MIMALTEKDEAFLWAVACDTLPRYNTLGALRRAASRLIRKGLLDSTQLGPWTRYSLTQAGRTALADAGQARQKRARKAEDAELHRRNMITG